jgi:PAS domain S-box-containing protein
MIWVTDATGGIEFINQAYRDFCGVTDDDVRERRWQMVVHPDDREHYLTEFLRCVQDKQPFYARCRIKRADGQWRWVASYGAPRFSEDGQFLGHVGSSPDVQDMHEAQERLQRWNIELKEAVNSKTAELLQSQERLRALATELNLAEQRERKRLAAELHDHLQQILVLGKLTLRQGKREVAHAPAAAETMKKVDELLSDALSYTRTLVSELSPSVLRDHGLVAGLKWLAESMKKHDLTVTVTLPEVFSVELPEAQTVLLFQSVRELLINASKHAGTGQATVKIAENDGRLEITVRDEGEGFDPAATAAEVPNGGLSSKFGLFSIRERMRAIGGWIEVQSAPGKGTTAMLILPLANLAIARTEDSRLKAESKISEEELGLGSEVQALQKSAKIRVLLVDDHAMMRQGLISILSGSSDLEIVGEAANGVEALRAVEKHRPAVVIMDINMPDMNGIEATTRIKSRYPEVTVIGLSVNAGDENQQAMLKAGAMMLLTKEAAVEQLYCAIQEVMKKSQPPDPVTTSI